LKLYWKKLNKNAKAPTCAHPGEDLAYDLYAAETVELSPGRTTLVSTGLALEFDPPHGAIIKDRSSMALKGIRTSAGVIDAGYRGEVRVLMTLDVNTPTTSTGNETASYVINAGDKIAQLIPVKSNTLFAVEEAEELKEAKRGEKGWGSSGQ
jgi:dUTP diphosphatase